MSPPDTGYRLTRQEIAWELVEIFEGLETEQINEMLAKNVPIETLQFFASYADDFGRSQSLDSDTRRRVPNLLLLGYLLRVLEDRLLQDSEPFDA